MVTLKNSQNFNLKNKILGKDNQILTMTLQRCNQTNSEIDCANDEELRDYVNKHKLNFMIDRTFVDYENVEPGVGPIGHATEVIETFYLSYENPVVVGFEAIEH